MQNQRSPTFAARILACGLTELDELGMAFELVQHVQCLFLIVDVLRVHLEVRGEGHKHIAEQTIWTPRLHALLQVLQELAIQLGDCGDAAEQGCQLRPREDLAVFGLGIRQWGDVQLHQQLQALHVCAFSVQGLHIVQGQEKSMD